MYTQRIASIFTLSIIMVIILLMFCGNAFAAATISNETFNQLDWYDEDDILAVQDSIWGEFEYSVNPDSNDIYYLNLVASTGGNPEAWVIQNLPVFPASVGEASSQSVEFDIEDLGLVSGNDMSSIDYDYTLSSTISVISPSGVPNSAIVENKKRFAWDLKPSGFLFLDPGKPAGVKAAAVAKNKTHHKNVPEVQEGAKKCFPGSFARSLSWLDTKHNLNFNRTAKQIYDDLIALKVGSSGPGATTLEQDINNKSTYAKQKSANRIVTKLFDLNNAVGTVTVSEAAGNFEVWIKGELSRGEDVELAYVFPVRGYHIVTIIGYYTQGGTTYLEYRDDENQGDDTKGDKAEKKRKLINKGGGSYGFGSNDTTITFAISESAETRTGSDTYVATIVGIFTIVIGAGLLSTVKKPKPISVVSI